MKSLDTTNADGMDVGKNPLLLECSEFSCSGS